MFSKLLLKFQSEALQLKKQLKKEQIQNHLFTNEIKHLKKVVEEKETKLKLLSNFKLKEMILVDQSLNKIQHDLQADCPDAFDVKVMVQDIQRKIDTIH
jgi:hypothetical protein